MSPRRVPPSTEWSVPAPEAAPDLATAAVQLKAAARELGFDPVGIAPAQLPEHERERLLQWLGVEQHGTMGYMAREPERRADASALLDGAQAVLVVGLAYPSASGHDSPAGSAVVSTYAQAPYDYHRVLAGRLAVLEAFFAQLCPGASARRFCDTSPLLERAFAYLAGLGFIGKNTNLIHRRRGSQFFLGGLVLDRALPHDAPDDVASCGSCTRCLDACPTDAFPAPYVLDARRCISYLTIEHRGAWDEDLRGQVGALTFGCDICSAVCPWNHKFAAPPDPELEPDPARRDPPLVQLARRVQAGFKSLARGTPWERTGKRGFLRNLATAMGNAGGPDCAELLDELAQHDDPAVADHARWARTRLRQRLESANPGRG